MNRPALLTELDELTAAEEFLEFFAIPFDSAVVQVNRLHILQRFHDYLDRAEAVPEEQIREVYRTLLQRAYDDFVHSNAQTEKVFKVFQRNAKEVFIPLGQIARKSLLASE